MKHSYWSSILSDQATEPSMKTANLKVGSHNPFFFNRIILLALFLLKERFIRVTDSLAPKVGSCEPALTLFGPGGGL